MKDLRRWSLLVLCAGFLLPVCVNAEWKKATLPDGGVVYSLATTGTDLFAATDNGVFRTSDYGVTWSQTGLKGILVTSVAFNDGRTFAATTTGLMVSTDLGLTWTVKVAGEASCVAISDGRVWTAARISAAPYISVYFSTDNGDHWTSIGSSGNIVNTIAAKGNLVFIGTGNGIYTSELLESGSSAWYSILPQTWTNALVATDTGMYAATWYVGYGMFVSQDFGSFQAPANNGLSSRDMHTVYVDGSTLYAGTYAGAFRSSNGGATWTSIGLESSEVNAFARAGTSLFAGTNGGVFVSLDDGASWTMVSNGLCGGGVYCLIPQGSDVLLTNTNGIFRSSDAGDSWTSIGLANHYVTSLLQNNSAIYAGTREGVWRSVDNGGSWTHLSTTGMLGWSLDVQSLAVTPSGTILAASINSSTYRSTDGGVSWEILGNGLGGPVYSLLATETCILAGTLFCTYRSTDEGLTWTRVAGDFYGPVREGHVGTMATRGNEIYAGGYSGVSVSTDDGQTWTRLNNGLITTCVRHLAVNGTNLYASTVDGLFVLPTGGTAWIPINGDGFADKDMFSSVVVGDNFLTIAKGGFFYTNLDPDPGRDVWKRPLSEVACCTGTYGNVNLVGAIDLSDLSMLVSYLTGGNVTLPCPIAANVTGSGIIDLGDLSALVNFLTGGGYVLPTCS